MSARGEEKRKKLILQTLVFGGITAALYATAFSHASALAELFARGGYYAALPIVTVFVFSFAHGAFAGKLWSVLGIEAATKHAVQRTTAPAPRPVQRQRPRLRMNA
ncbi:MAG: hypothetical protein LDL33_10520 [Desulfomonile sp.]|nr:hypothetical protein [Desulfomonile sp.]